MISFEKFTIQDDVDKYNMLLHSCAEIEKLQQEKNQLKGRMDRVFSRITLWKMEDISMETARVLDDLLKVVKGEPNNE